MEIVLNSYGGSLSRSNSNFLVCNDETSQLVPVYGVTAIYVWRSTRVSTDALLLALDNDIDIVLMDRRGDVKGRMWNCKFGSIASIRKGQLYFEFSPEGVTWIKATLSMKIAAQINILRTYEVELADSLDVRSKKRLAWSINKMELSMAQISSLHSDKVAPIASSLRGLEGIASKVYFQAMVTLLPKVLTFRKRQQRPARDIVNAMLNYGYAILYNRVENALIKVGIDPAIGLLHVDSYNHPVFTYDVIEPFRCWVDHVVFQMAMCGEVKSSMAEPTEDGNSVWLTDELRQTLSMRIINALSIVADSRHGWSRENVIQMNAQSLAQTFKKLYQRNKR